MAKNGNFFAEPNLNVDEHQVLINYRTTMSRLLRSVYPHVAQSDIEAGITYSIQKRFKNANATITNNYLNSSIDTTILEMCDYIAQREPIITSYGVLFKRHGTVKNPLGDSIDNFLKLRKVHKKEMFKYPKVSEMFEHFNLLQALDKIDVNFRIGSSARLERPSCKPLRNCWDILKPMCP